MELSTEKKSKIGTFHVDRLFWDTLSNSSGNSLDEFTEDVNLDEESFRLSLSRFILCYEKIIDR